MKSGIINSPKVNQKYKIYLSDGGFMTVIYRGFGRWLSSQWEVLETGEVQTSLPPMVGYEELPAQIADRVV